MATQFPCRRDRGQKDGTRRPRDPDERDELVAIVAGSEVFQSGITFKENIQDDHINRAGIEFTQILGFHAVHGGQHLIPFLSEGEGPNRAESPDLDQSSG